MLLCRSLADGTLAGECARGVGFQDFQVYALGHASISLRTRLGVTEALQLGTLVLAPGGDIVGRVVDEAGRFVSGASVAAYAGESFPANADDARAGEFDAHERVVAFFSDANGRFRIRGAPFGPRFVVVQATPGSPFGWSEVFELTEVVRLLAVGGKTGVLRLEGSRGSGRLWVKKGKVTSIEVDHAPRTGSHAEATCVISALFAGSMKCT